MTIRRRNFLSMMAAAPLAANLTGLLAGCETPEPTKSSTFYVWVHGVFGITWMKPADPGKPANIRLVCPNLTAHSGGAHSYSIGRITATGEELYKLEKSGSSKSEYTFEGLKPGSEGSITPLKVGAPALHGTLHSDFDGYAFYLPSPSKIISLRSFFANFKCSGDCTSFPQGDMWLPMVHVFAYEDVTPEKVSLTSSASKKSVWGGKKSNHCHLFVEPENIQMEDEKYDAALKALRACFDKAEDISIEDREPCLRLDDVLGFCDDLREQFYLYEWRNQNPCSIGRAKNGGKPGEKTYKPQGCPQFWVIES